MTTYDKEKQKACNKAYYAAHRDEIKARHKAYGVAHREEQKLYQRAYRAGHRDEQKAYRKAYHAAHRDEQMSYQRLYRAAHRDEARAYGAAHRDEHKDRALLRKYGIAPGEWQKIFNRQGGACAICGGIEKKGRRLCVDHAHATGKVRGLLCVRCNSSLERMETAGVEWARRALAYIAVASSGAVST